MRIQVRSDRHNGIRVDAIGKVTHPAYELIRGPNESNIAAVTTAR